MEIGILGTIFKWYLILDVAFIITSLFTLHFPAWRIARSWAKEYLEEYYWPSTKYIFSHTIAYSFVAFIVFPILLPILLINNNEAIAGYTKSLIKSLNESSIEDKLFKTSNKKDDDNEKN